jgi:hypothetical protein
MNGIRVARPCDPVTKPGGKKADDDQSATQGPTCSWVADMAPHTLVGKTLHALDGVGASCPANTGMVAWKFAKVGRCRLTRWYPCCNRL